jgi:hypothetical protein
MAFTKLKMAVLAPVPRASVNRATAVNRESGVAFEVLSAWKFFRLWTPGVWLAAAATALLWRAKSYAPERGLGKNE